MEPIVVILQTFKRTDCALRTVMAARQYLRYDGPLLWYVADDGSSEWHLMEVQAALMDAPWIGWHSERRGYGANANAAWDAANEISALTFWLEDDWELTAPLDLTPYAYLLMEREDIGMVRLGYLNAGIIGETFGYGGRLYWKLHHEPAQSYELVFTGHPSLRHRRYRQDYGDYETGLVPGDTELAYAYRYRIGSGSWIVWPASYPPEGLFSHIGTVKTETML